MKNITIEEVKNNLVDNDGILSFEKEEENAFLYIDFYEPTFASYFFVSATGTDYTGKAQEATEEATLKKVVELVNHDLNYHYNR